VSADSEHSMDQPVQDQAPDRDMTDLPVLEEPDWYAEDPGGIDDPVWESPDLGVPGWESPAPGDPVWEAPAPGDPVWETLDLHDPSEDPAAGVPFADGGWADGLAPDPVLATLVDLVQRDGLGKLDDDQLTGVLQAAGRLAAWSAAAKLTAVSALAARREAAGRVSGDWRPFEHADDEIAVALTLTRRSAGRLLDLALELDRLPLTRAALAKGLIDERRAEVIAEELSGLDDAGAAAVEKLIIGGAPGLTTGQLRALARRAVLSADPKAARRRKEKALADARVEMFPETAGTAALAGRDLPPAAVLAADKHLTALAQAMKAAGQPGTLDILRAWAYLHLLSGKPAATLLHTAQHNTTPGDATPGDATPGDATPGDATPGRRHPGRRHPGRRHPERRHPGRPGYPRQHAGWRTGQCRGRPAQPTAGRDRPAGRAWRSRCRNELPRGTGLPDVRCPRAGPGRRPRPGRAARHGQPDHAAVGVARLDRGPRRRPRLRPY